MRTIEKKIHPKYLNEILEGKKKFEIRLADFEIEKGDILYLREFDPKTQSYTGVGIKKKVKCVIKTKDLDFWEEKDVRKYGFLVLNW